MLCVCVWLCGVDFACIKVVLVGNVSEKKRQAALHKEAAWDGSLANTTAVPAAASLDAAH